MIDKKLEFDYLNLEKYLYEMYKQGIDNVNLFIFVSLENDNYHGEHLENFLLDLKKLLDNFNFNFDGKEVKFNINKLSINVGDVLNRYNILYRYYAEYITENNLFDESQIPENIKQNMMTEAYNLGKQMGKDWFRNEMTNALNLILPDNYKILKNLELNDKITKLYIGDENIPEINYICHENWLTHPNFEKTKKALDETRNLENSVIERTYEHESELHLAMVEKRYGKMKYPEIFIRCSKQYLVDETVECTLIQRQSNNNIYLYCGGCELQHHRVFSGRKARNNKTIQKHLEGDLKCIAYGN